MNTHNHCMALATGVATRPPGILRHSSTHRAKLRAKEAAKVTVICARIEAGLMHEDRSERDLAFDLIPWIRERRGSPIDGKSERSGPSVTSPFGAVRCIQVFSVYGPVVLPAKVKGWILTKATPEEEAWARKRAKQ